MVGHSKMTTNNVSSIDNLIKVYVDARDEFGREATLKALRKHYSDHCSHGDHIINTLITMLEKEVCPDDMATVDEDADYFAGHIAENLEEWLAEGRPRPNPWWAS